MKKIVIGMGMILSFAGVTLSQNLIEPTVTKTIKPLTRRDNKIESAIKKYGECDNSGRNRGRRGCYYAKIDLNGDNVPEVIAYAYGREFCGTSGCDALILKLMNGRYQLITHIEPARDPIIVSNNKTHGWKNLLIFVSGGVKSHWAVLEFNGKTYPRNSTVEDAAPPLTKKVRGIRIQEHKY